MTSLRQRALRALSQDGLVDGILHIGAGHGTLLPDLISTGASSIILSELDPNLSVRLGRQIPSGAHVRLLERPLAVAVGDIELHRFSMPGYASPYAITGLRNLYPNLKNTDTITVQVQAVTDFLSTDPDVQEGNSHVLILDGAGTEMAILQALDTLLIQKFRHVFVKTPLVPLYDQAATGSDLKALLLDAGYDLVAEDSTGDPDIPDCYFRRNPRASELLQLRQDKAELSLRLVQAAQDAKLLKAEGQALKGANAKLEQEAKTASLQLGALTEECNTLRQTTNDQSAELQAAGVENADLKEKLHLLQTKNAELEEAKEVIARTQEVALNTLALRNMDMDHLQSQHDELIKQLEARDRVLQKLADHIAVATTQLDSAPPTPLKRAGKQGSRKATPSHAKARKTNSVNDD